MKEPESMREIHEIMEKLYNERKNMTREEVIKDVHRGAEELMRRYGLKIIEAQPKVVVGK